MPSADDTSLPATTGQTTPSFFPEPPGVGDDTHNTVFQRMLDRVGEDEGQVPLVLACLAYYNYKIAKRKWIMDWTAKNSQKPIKKDVDYFVSTWDDLNIDRAFAIAREDIRAFMVNVVDDTKEEISEQVYLSLFKDLEDQIKSHTASSETRAKTMSDLVRDRTKSNWFLSACADVIVSVIANFIWFALTIVILIGLYAQFDFTKFMERTKGLFTAQESAVSQDKIKPNP